ncbi:MAG: YggS family pyridoxal phosphate-dependent enzyme [Treponema sp.]|nr:YggS family pyridoxal phosphate-dependent enzyme [Treponema sp.]
MSIAENIARIEERIQKVCDTSGRRREEITLMGVSKFQPVSVIEEAFNAGIRCFGESRVKEGIEKLSVFKEKHSGAALHLIGSLQRNKAKPAALFFDCIQSVDREALAGELVKSAANREKPLAVLLELHTGEESKSGFAGLDALFRAAEMILGSCLMPQGLMTMAPYTSDAGLIRSSFRLLVKAQKELERRFPPVENWACLSMGMSNDFEIAVEEGSTMLRIGSLIFGDL